MFAVGFISILSKKDKLCLKQTIKYLVNEDNKTLGEILDFAEEKGILQEGQLFNDYILNKGFYLWGRIKNMPFKQYRKNIFYLKEFSPMCI